MGGHGGIEGEYSASKVFANVFISFVGAGVLGLPYAFSQAGYAIGTIVMIFVVIISVKAMLLLVDCKNNLVERIRRNDSVVQGLSIDPEDPDFVDLALVVYGKRGWCRCSLAPCTPPQAPGIAPTRHTRGRCEYWIFGCWLETQGRVADDVKAAQRELEAAKRMRTLDGHLRERRFR